MNAVAQAEKSPIRVLIVDDSVVIRGLIARMIAERPDVAQVVATVSNGALAVERVKKGDIDLVLLDIEMPIMDGITALPKLVEACPSVSIIMSSTLTTRNAQISLQALALGAKDYIAKPTAQSELYRADDFKRELFDKIIALGQRHHGSSIVIPKNESKSQKVQEIKLRSVAPGKAIALAIGSSTGGPRALAEVLKKLPSPLRVPVFITQHMPPTFTELLARSLSAECNIDCREATHGEVVKAGRVYLAPGDYHMTVQVEGSNKVIRLNQDAKENFCRPAADPMLRSIAAAYGHAVLVVMLTGMGHDGLAGSRDVVATGGNIIAQDEATSVVWGMPGAVATNGLCCRVLPLEKLGPQIATMLAG